MKYQYILLINSLIILAKTQNTLIYKHQTQIIFQQPQHAYQTASGTDQHRPLYNICTILVQYMYVYQLYIYCTSIVHILYNGRSWYLKALIMNACF